MARLKLNKSGNNSSIGEKNSLSPPTPVDSWYYINLGTEAEGSGRLSRIPFSQERVTIIEPPQTQFVDSIIPSIETMACKPSTKNATASKKKAKVPAKRRDEKKATAQKTRSRPRKATKRTVNRSPTPQTVEDNATEAAVKPFTLERAENDSKDLAVYSQTDADFWKDLERSPSPTPVYMKSFVRASLRSQMWDQAKEDVIEHEQCMRTDSQHTYTYASNSPRTQKRSRTSSDSTSDAWILPPLYPHNAGPVPSFHPTATNDPVPEHYPIQEYRLDAVFPEETDRSPRNLRLHTYYQQPERSALYERYGFDDDVMSKWYPTLEPNRSNRVVRTVPGRQKRGRRVVRRVSFGSSTIESCLRFTRKVLSFGLPPPPNFGERPDPVPLAGQKRKRFEFELELED
ncbi:hypothetical protein M501DRAFT_674889 [Patellaria atrata CBS 101060]|uniref:Uncharacterized protein n=1 Tax=Patellaria atrata CBS 101060 TaxID=1346257 RepID=A0A9P4VQP8_9PEZI|nr:hypothetical protein M501DRAFT_674889 [Patellaria atrata CBS 101060]